MLLGKPAVTAADMPVAAANSLSVAYGDFKQGYTIVDRMGIRVLRDPFTAAPYVRSLFDQAGRRRGDAERGAEASETGVIAQVSDANRTKHPRPQEGHDDERP